MFSVSRRELIKAGLATAVLARTARAAASPVYIVRTTDRAEGIRRGLAALGMASPRGKRVVIKPNLNSADEYPASTHLDTLGALVRHLQAAGAAEITLADRSGMGDTRRVMEQKGVFAQAKRMGYQVVVLDETPMEGWAEERLPGSRWSKGVLFPRRLQEADLLVQTCCLKTHRFGGHFTLSLKNSVGLAAKAVPGEGYNYMTELHNSPAQRAMIAEVNAAYSPALIVLDGVEAFTSGGPEAGNRVEAQVVLAGVDRIAVDAVGVAILRDLGTTANVRRRRIFEQEQIARAVELGLGVQQAEALTIVSDDAAGRAYADQLRPILEGDGE
jgi:uncharacterized protein (DUF362 family)